MFYISLLLTATFAIVSFLIVSPKIRTSFLSVLATTTGKPERDLVVYKYMALLTVSAFVFVLPFAMVLAYGLHGSSDIGRVASVLDISGDYFSFFRSVLLAVLGSLAVIFVLLHVQFVGHFSTDAKIRDSVDYELASTRASMVGVASITIGLIASLFVFPVASGSNNSLYDYYLLDGDGGNVTEILVESCGESYDVGMLSLNTSSTVYTLWCGHNDDDDDTMIVFRNGEIDSVADEKGMEVSVLRGYGFGSSKFIFSLKDDAQKYVLGHYSPFFFSLGSVQEAAHAFSLIDSIVDGHRPIIKASALEALELQTFKVQ